MTRNSILSAAVLLALAAFNPGSGALRAQELPPEAASQLRLALVTWLECEECTEGELEAVQRYGAAAVPSLGHVLARGPSAASRERVRRHLESSYADILVAAKKGDEKVELSQEEYVKYYLANYVGNYQVRSAQALAAIGGEEARKLLATAIASKTLRDDVQAAVEAAAKGSR
jgi:hypothetical protein